MATTETGSHGGFSEAALQAALAEASLIVHSPPDIPDDAEIVGVCAVNEEDAGPKKLGWVVADFVTWKTLFHNVGDEHHQHWFSTLDVERFSKDYSGLDLNGSDIGEKILGKHRDHIHHLPANNALFVRAFLDTIITRARVAAERNTSLFIMCFAPVTAEQTIVVDFDQAIHSKAFIPVDWIRAVVREAVGYDLRVIFLTPSSFTGGWMCRPTLFPQQIAGATSESIRRTIAKTCGGIFADSCVKLFTTRDCPFLTDDQRTGIVYQDMTPVGQTEYQAMTLHAFERGIHEALERRACPLAKSHLFNFDPETDAWTTLAPRQHRPLNFWGKKWVPVDGPHEDCDRFASLGEAHGGTRASQLFWLKYLTSTERETCPGDWGSGSTGPTPKIFHDFIQDVDPTINTFKRVFDTLEFRGSSFCFAHIIAKAVGLHFPGADCRFWRDGANDEAHIVRIMQLSFGDLIRLLDLPAVFPGETRHDYMYIRSFRQTRWIATAMASKLTQSADPGVMKAFINQEIAPLITAIRKIQQSILKEDGRIRDLGAKWLKSLNLGITLTNTTQVDVGTPSEQMLVDVQSAPAVHVPTDEGQKTDHAVPTMWAIVPPTFPLSLSEDAESSTQALVQPATEAVVETGLQPSLQSSIHARNKLNVNAKPYVPLQQESWRVDQPETTETASKPSLNVLASKRCIMNHLGIRPKKIAPVAEQPIEVSAAKTDESPKEVAEAVKPTEDSATKAEESPKEVVEAIKPTEDSATKIDKSSKEVVEAVTTPVTTPVARLENDFDALMKAFNASKKVKHTAPKIEEDIIEVVERPILGHWKDCSSKVDDVEQMATADDDLKDLLAKDWTKPSRGAAFRAAAYHPIGSGVGEMLERIKGRNVVSPTKKSDVKDDGNDAVQSDNVEKAQDDDHDAAQSEDVFGTGVEKAQDDDHNAVQSDNVEKAQGVGAQSEFLKVIKELMETDPMKALQMMSNFRLEAQTPPANESSAEGSEMADENEISVLSLAPENTFLTEATLCESPSKVRTHADQTSEVFEAPAGGSSEHKSHDGFSSMADNPEHGTSPQKETSTPAVFDASAKTDKVSVEVDETSVVKAPTLATANDFWAAVPW